MLLKTPLSRKTQTLNYYLVALQLIINDWIHVKFHVRIRMENTSGKRDREEKAMQINVLLQGQLKLLLTE